jgi:hypothetical protein
MAVSGWPAHRPGGLWLASTPLDTPSHMSPSKGELHEKGLMDETDNINLYSLGKKVWHLYMKKCSFSKGIIFDSLSSKFK